jgi:putative nucleotidyltransferase with HDIG domain
MSEEITNDHTLNTLLEISRTIISTLDIERVDEVILRQTERIFHNDHGALFILDDKSGHLGLAAARGFSEDDLENLKILGAWEKINQMAMNSHQALVVNDVAKNPELNKKDFPFRSFLSIRLEVEKKTVGILNLSNKEPLSSFDATQLRILEILANYAAIALVNARLYKGTEDLFISLISSLVAAIDAKDPYTAGHSQRVTKIALGIADEMGLSHERIKSLKLAAILHDIGKIGISELILAKPSELTPEEHKAIEQHPDIGVKIVSTIPNSARFIRGINDHHEFYNGRGYPKGLKGDEISLEGRVIAVADALDAITSGRAYRKGLSLTEANEEIEKNAGEQFDPNVVEALLRLHKKNPELLSR